MYEKKEQFEEKGAIIVAKGKVRIKQIYRTLRNLDVQERIKVNRAASSLQMKSPIVELITQKDETKKKVSENEMFDISMTNVINNASWRHTDVLVTSPFILKYLLDKSKFNQHDLLPETVVFEDLGDCFKDEKLSNACMDLLKKFDGKTQWKKELKDLLQKD